MIKQTIVDLTHTLNENTPSWDGGCGFHHKTLLDYIECESKVKFCVQEISMHAGIGTHIDAPAHCDPKGLCINEISLEKLIAPCRVIDISHKAHESYSFTKEDLREFEKIQGKIDPECIVMIYTGWDKYWNTPTYHNNFKFPSVSQEAAEELLSRNILGLGIDTLSPDRPESHYPVHEILLKSGRWIIENVANLSKLPPKGSLCMALPLKISLTEAPIRLVGIHHETPA